MMELGSIIFLVLLLAISASGQQDRIVWVDAMEDFTIAEDTPNGKSIYQLRATYQGSSTGIKYGINNNPLDPKDNTYKQEGNRFQVFPNGTVFTFNAELDFEGDEKQFKINLIALLEANEDIFTKRRSNIIVKDVNDNSPIFDKQDYEATVDENYEPPVGGALLVSGIRISDVDLKPSQGVEFIGCTIIKCRKGTDLTEFPCGQYFAIRPQNNELSEREYIGDFYIMQKLDYEDAAVWQVTLRADDGVFSTAADVVIHLNDKQDSPPDWVFIPTQFNHPERPANYDLGYVEAEDTDGNVLLRRNISYSLIPTTDPQIGEEFYPEKYFGIRQFTGVLYNKVPLDLESMPFTEHPEENIWTINIRACEIISYDPFEVGSTVGLDCVDGTTTVKINDVNDNPPLFDRDVYTYYIQEDIRNLDNLGDPRIIITDADSDQYNKFTVNFTTESREFQLSATDRSPFIQVKNTDLIDYDTGPRRYDLVLEARDNKDPTNLLDSADIIIHVLDANDNRPVFGQTTYTRAINENAKPQTNIIKITATDIDEEFKGTDGIRYSLEGVYKELFSIDDLSGQVTVGPCAGTPGEDPCIDYEVPPNDYVFKVRAQDENGKGPSPSYATLHIKINDVNDNAPQVQDYNVDILEMQTKTIPDLFVEGVDPDVHDVLKYYIQSQPLPDGIAYWQIDEDTGHITATRPIRYGDAPKDGSGKARFELIVLVSDANPDHNAYSQVTINVIDINDNAPIFIPKDYTITIPEVTPGGTYLLDVSAEDADDGTVPNGMIQYYIESGGLGKFQINTENGSMYTALDANFAGLEKKRYEVLIVASDRGKPQQSGTGTVTVIITDSNNQAPKFVPFSRRMSVYDNAPIGTTIDFLSAIDPDSDAVLRFSFKEPKTAITPDASIVDRTAYDYTNLFRVDEESGAVIVNQQLDYEKAKLVTYAASVRDITPVELQEGNGTVIIDIKDYNTLPPRFQQLNRNITIPEEQGDGTFVTSFIATDDDGLIEGFRIVEQPDDFFEISFESGFVTIKEQVDYDDERRTNSSYFVVVVTDNGEPTLSASATVSVYFYNINDNLPTFTKEVYVAEIDENAPDGTELIAVTATDADRPDENGFHDVRYRMDDDRFDINATTGQICVRRRNNKELDREATPTLVIQVTAYDTPNGPESVRKQTVASVIITLRDQNDNPPRFAKGNYSARIYETAAIDMEILQLFTSDNDLGFFGQVAYEKVPDSGTDKLDLFRVNSTNGRIYVNKNLVGHVKTFHFLVRAQDEKGTGPFVAIANVTITVLAAANQPPRFVRPPKDNATVYVLEEQYNGMIVLDRVSAVDSDTGINGIVEYSFIHKGKERQATDEFLINRVTGVIQAEIIFDRERQDKYVLLLKAKDLGETSLEATRFLTVAVLDVNDNEPYFKDNELEFRVAEDVPIGTEVTGSKKIEAFDRDLNPVIYYEIIAGNEDGAFYLDRNSGRLYTNKLLDTEIKGVYSLDIKASNDEPDDTVIRYRKKRAVDPSIVTVKILVGDINDEAPVFLGQPYYGCVSSRSSFDKHILTVSAVDNDAVGTGVVRFRLMNELTNSNGQPLFGIHDTFGVISNKVLMRDYTDEVFNLVVNARDRVDIANSESVNTTAQIYVTQPGKEAQLLIKQNTAEVRLYQNQIQRIIEKSQHLDRVCINLIRDHVINTAGETSPLWSDVYISGIRFGQNGAVSILSATETTNIVKTEISARPQDFENLYIAEVKAASSDETSIKESFVLIVMIIIAVLIFLVILFIILAYLCIRAAKQEKKARLIQRTQAGPPIPVIIEKQEEPIPVVFQAPEPVQYDNKTFVIEQPGPPPPQEQMVVEPEPVHVQYAMVQKRPQPLGLEILRTPTPEPVDQEDIIIVSQFRDEPQPVDQDVFQPTQEEDEFRIVTEPM